MSLLSATAQLARQLLQIPSVTPADAGCQKLIGNRLQNVGFNIESMRFADVDHPGVDNPRVDNPRVDNPRVDNPCVDNLWARRGTEGPLLVLAGHTDVVPTGDVTQWTYPPFDAKIVDDMIYGRGAADMKGSIAAMVTATERYLAANDPKGSIAFLITSDEEGPAINGTARVIETLEARGEKIDWCIVGEPTSIDTLGDTIKNGRRGSLSATLRVRGVQGHVAYPHLADNPIHRVLAPLNELINIEWDRGNDFFPATSLQISNIHAGTGANNVIPGEVVIKFNLRFSPENSPEEIQQKTIELLDNHALDYAMDWSLSGSSFLTQPGSLTKVVKEAIATRCGINANLDTGGGTSDGRFIAPTGAQVIELGPRNATIHQIDECVSLSDLDSLSEIYEDILTGLLS